MNRFLLCTLVWGVAQEIKARAGQNGEELSLPMIARDVLRFFLRSESAYPGFSAASADNINLFNEEGLGSDIERLFQEYLKQGRDQRSEARRLDLESITAAEEAKRKRWIAKRG